MKTTILILSVAILVTACAPAATPVPGLSPLPPTLASPSAPDVVSPVATPSRQMLIEPIQIEKVEVQIAESQPVQVSAHVTGVIGDGCSSVQPVKQQRDGNTITLTINRQRPADAMCIQIAKLYDETIHLNGDFPPGDYVLKVNAVRQTFTIH